MTRLLNLTGLALGVFLTGCATSTITGEWECPYEKGQGCLSIEEADQTALRQPNGLPPTTSSPGAPSSTQTPAFQAYPLKLVPGTPLRQPETVQRIWFAPFTDKHGYWHDQKFLYFVDRKSHWMTDTPTTR